MAYNYYQRPFRYAGVWVKGHERHNPWVTSGVTNMSSANFLPKHTGLPILGYGFQIHHVLKSITTQYRTLFSRVSFDYF